MRRTEILVFVALASVPRAAWPQGGNPLGPEFRVNTFTSQIQSQSSVAGDLSGNFLVVWQSAVQDGEIYGVFGQRYASSGAPIGPEFRVNTYTTSVQFQPAVAASVDGSFVVVWRSYGQDGPLIDGIFGQRYASTGVPQGPEFRVNTYTTSYQYRPRVASDFTGNFVVLWSSRTQDGSGYGVFGQRYGGSGPPLGPEFRVNTTTPGDQILSDLAADSAGNFVVAWMAEAQDGSGFGVFGQRYANSGATLGSEFRINSYTTNSQGGASVAIDSFGNFVVVWESYSQDNSNSGIFGQRYSVAGTPAGPEFRVNTYTTGAQSGPRVASDAAGNFVVIWTSDAQDGSSWGVFGQRYSASGGPVGPEFRVNTYTTGYQDFPSVGARGNGDFIVTWDSQAQDGSFHGVFGQRYGQIFPADLMRFTVE